MYGARPYRLFNRVVVNLPVEIPVKMNEADRQRRRAGRILSLSKGGFFVSTLVAPRTGEPISASIQLPISDQLIQVRGTVIWVNHDTTLSASFPELGFGVRTDEIDTQDLDRLDYFIAKIDIVQDLRRRLASTEDRLRHQALTDWFYCCS